MTNLTIKDRNFTIEFRHTTKLGKRRQLYDRAPVKAITTCVIVAHDIPVADDHAIAFIAIDHSICANGDNFSRREGRLGALRKTLKHCGALKDLAEQIWDEYLKIDPAPYPPRPRPDSAGYFIIQETLSGNVRRPVAVPPQRPKLTVEEVEARWLAGAQTRLARQRAREFDRSAGQL